MEAPLPQTPASNGADNNIVMDDFLSPTASAAAADIKPLPARVGVALVKLAARLEPNPEGFDKVSDADQDAVFNAFARLEKLHERENEAPEEWYCREIRSKTPYSQSAVIAYECVALGYRRPIRAREVNVLLGAHRRFEDVYWDPLRTGKNPRLVGALVVRVNTAEYTALLESGKASMRDASSDPGAASAPPTPPPPKRRFFGLL